MKKTLINLAVMGALAAASNVALADCAALPTHAQLKAALITARNQANGGFNLDMWGTIVDRDGIVCAVAYTGGDRGAQWPGSRVISAQKANTANAFSLTGLALSTANLYTATQPGGSLFGLQLSNPVDTAVAYKGPSIKYGQPNDPMVRNKIGGVNVFGGGLALYNNAGTLLGAIGVSGDSSCADHHIAWRTRNGLGLDYVPHTATISGDATRPDNIVYDIAVFDIDPGAPVVNVGGTSAGGWGHPSCAAGVAAIAGALPVVP